MDVRGALRSGLWWSYEIDAYDPLFSVDDLARASIAAAIWRRPMFAEYADLFANVAMTRSDGVLVMQLHTDGSLLWSDEVHTQLPFAFRAVAGDDENRVVV
jgi:hypothetical protein